MSRRSNTFPYTNAREAGRTQPGLIEDRATAPTKSKGWLGSLLTPRTPEGVVPNRRDLRARGVRGPGRGPLALKVRTTRVVRPKCVHGAALPFPWSQVESYCAECARETTARLAAAQEAAEEAAVAAAAVKPARRRRTAKVEA